MNSGNAERQIRISLSIRLESSITNHGGKRRLLRELPDTFNQVLVTVSIIRYQFTEFRDDVERMHIVCTKLDAATIEPKG
jgi:hypothetical protein